tara:strand:- start:274 stop:426 length:153 start_codon:yes stop_codon:yes gene_type:complete
MKKTANKWDNITPLQKSIGNMLKLVGVLIFLSVWIPAIVHVVKEIIKFLA